MPMDGLFADIMFLWPTVPIARSRKCLRLTTAISSARQGEQANSPVRAEQLANDESLTSVFAEKLSRVDAERTARRDPRSYKANQNHRGYSAEKHEGIARRRLVH